MVQKKHRSILRDLLYLTKIIAHLSSHALNLFVMAGNARFSGFNIDMWEEIARRLNLTNFEFVKVDEGPTKISDGVFAGIIGGLQKLVSYSWPYIQDANTTPLTNQMYIYIKSYGVEKELIS